MASNFWKNLGKRLATNFLESAASSVLPALTQLSVSGQQRGALNLAQSGAQIATAPVVSPLVPIVGFVVVGVGVVVAVVLLSGRGKRR